MGHVLPEEFNSKVLSSQQKTLVLFYVDWCPYCANFKPTFEELGSCSLQKKVALVNEDENPLGTDSTYKQFLPLLLFKMEGFLQEKMQRKDRSNKI